MASKYLTNDQQNFTRLVIVCVDLIKLVLNDILKSQITPKDLYNAISSCPDLTSGRQMLRPEQQRICYQPSPFVPDYSTFDVTLLYTLIRNLCPSLKPTLGWGKKPFHLQITIGDDIERFRVFRNELSGHSTSSTVSDTEFASQWADIEIVMKRTQQWILPQGCSADYSQELERIKNLDLGSKIMQEYKLVLEGMMILLKNTENEGKWSLMYMYTVFNICK
jgi:hypothetical protein